MDSIEAFKSSLFDENSDEIVISQEKENLFSLNQKKKKTSKNIKGKNIGGNSKNSVKNILKKRKKKGKTEILPKKDRILEKFRQNNDLSKRSTYFLKPPRKRKREEVEGNDQENTNELFSILGIFGKGKQSDTLGKNENYEPSRKKQKVRNEKVLDEVFKEQESPFVKLQSSSKQENKRNDPMKINQPPPPSMKRTSVPPPPPSSTSSITITNLSATNQMKQSKETTKVLSFDNSKKKKKKSSKEEMNFEEDGFFPSSEKHKSTENSFSRNLVFCFSDEHIKSQMAKRHFEKRRRKAKKLMLQSAHFILPKDQKIKETAEKIDDVCGEIVLQSVLLLNNERKLRKQMLSVNKYFEELEEKKIQLENTSFHQKRLSNNKNREEKELIIKSTEYIITTSSDGE